MTKERINIAFLKPRFSIGQVIYVPQKQEVVKSDILRYQAEIGMEYTPEINQAMLDKDFRKEFTGTLLGGVKRYIIRQFVDVRRGEDSIFTDCIESRDFYIYSEKAQQASEFLEVKLDEEEWRIAIGDRNVEDENSPYYLKNCNLPRCCADISKARDILIYCRKNNGLIVHYRDELADLINGHGFECKPQSQIEKIFRQLKIR